MCTRSLIWCTKSEILAISQSGVTGHMAVPGFKLLPSDMQVRLCPQWLRVRRTPLVAMWDKTNLEVSIPRGDGCFFVRIIEHVIVDADQFGISGPSDGLENRKNIIGFVCVFLLLFFAAAAPNRWWKEEGVVEAAPDAAGCFVSVSWWTQGSGRLNDKSNGP
jgi:hypothetical protein